MDFALTPEQELMREACDAWSPAKSIPARPQRCRPQPAEVSVPACPAPTRRTWSHCGEIAGEDRRKRHRHARLRHHGGADSTADRRFAHRPRSFQRAPERGRQRRAACAPAAGFRCREENLLHRVDGAGYRLRPARHTHAAHPHRQAPVLNGRKMWITNVSACDAILVTCLDARDGDASGKVIKVVDRARSFSVRSREIDTIGLKQGLLGEALFQDCEMATRERRREASAGGTEVIENFVGGKSSLVRSARSRPRAAGLRDGARVFEDAQAVRQTDRRTSIGAEESFRHRHRHHDQPLVVLLGVVDDRSRASDRGSCSHGQALLPKRVSGCDLAGDELFGAMGFSTEGRIEALYRDIRMIAIPDGTNEILALIHGRDLTGMEAFRGLQRDATERRSRWERQSQHRRFAEFLVSMRRREIPPQCARQRPSVSCRLGRCRMGAKDELAAHVVHATAGVVLAGRSTVLLGGAAAAPVAALATALSRIASISMTPM